MEYSGEHIAKHSNLMTATTYYITSEPNKSVPSFKRNLDYFFSSKQYFLVFFRIMYLAASPLLSIS